MLITKVYKREGDSHAKMLTTDPKTIKNGGQFTSPLPPHTTFFSRKPHLCFTNLESPFPPPSTSIRGGID